MRRKPFVETLLQQVAGSFMTWVAVAVGAVTLYFFYKGRRGTRQPPPPPPRTIAGNAVSQSNMSDDGNDLMNKIKRKHFVGSKVCIAWEVLCDGSTWRDEGAAEDVLRWYAFSSDVYLMCSIQNDQEKSVILGMLKDKERLQRHKILFCTSAKGYEAFTRQICPALLLTHDSFQASFLSGVLPYIVLVGGKETVNKGNVACVSSVTAVAFEES